VHRPGARFHVQQSTNNKHLMQGAALLTVSKQKTSNTHTLHAGGYGVTGQGMTPYTYPEMTTER